MGKLMADHIQGRCEPLKDVAVSISEDHLRAIPECIVVVLSKMDGGVERQSLAINGVALEDIPVEIIGMSKPVVCFIRRNVSYRWSAFAAYDLTRQVLRMLGIIDRAVRGAAWADRECVGSL